MEGLPDGKIVERVPEHSAAMMAAISGGAPFCVDSWFFLAGGDWLMAIGYPLRGRYNAADFARAVAKAREKTGASRIFAIAPDFAGFPQADILEKDSYYVLSADAPIPKKLRGPVKNAARLLRVDEGNEFTAAHRRLWSEFLDMRGVQMTERVAGLYAAFPTAPRATPGLRFLNAWNADGNLVACLALDYAPRHFVSYILGAHSRRHYAPHAVDLLFAAMLENARREGKRFIHLGLGVNDGILKFKKKWGAREYFPFQMAQWEAAAAEDDLAGASAVKTIALAMLRSGGSARQVLGDTPNRKPFAMLWKVEKNGKVSWLAGTAHFFCHSFEPSFRKLFREVDNVVFEGPLDQDFMAQVNQAGQSLPPGAAPLIDFLDEADVAKLEKTVLGPRGFWARALNIEKHFDIDVRWLLANAPPWNACFTLWTTFLERHGWKESVDMEAWRVARAMGKNIIAMENLEEQLESLGSMPAERVLRFFRNCHQWRGMAARNLSAYLAGDLEKMMGSSAEFPTRTEHVVGRRDQRFRERMRPYLERGRCAVFVGSAHLVNLRHMLMADGFAVSQRPFGLWPRLRLALRSRVRPDEEIKW